MSTMKIKKGDTVKVIAGKDKGKETKELEGSVILKERPNHSDDLNAVTNGIKLGFRSCWAISVFHRHIFDAPAMVDGVD